MRASVPSIHCDDESGCDAWEIDHYETCASTVGGVKITSEQPAPGWTRTPAGDDFCPEHAPQ